MSRFQIGATIGTMKRNSTKRCEIFEFVTMLQKPGQTEIDLELKNPEELRFRNS
jgi:hypothetical protein